MHMTLCCCVCVAAIGQIPEGRVDCGTILAIVSDYRQKLVLPSDARPWDIMHMLLVCGPSATIVDGNRKVPVLEHLAHCTVRSDPFLMRRGTMVIPYTDNIPHETAQDHDNQYLATLAQVGVDGDLYGKSGGDPGDWSGLLKGCWGSAFVPERELSWTLICYAGYYGQMEGSETEKLERLESVVKTVATRDAGQGACGGSHAFFALAFFLRSEAAAKTSQEVRQMADRCLTARVLEVVPRLTETARRYQAGMLGLTPLEASKSIMQEFGHHLEWLSIYCADDTLLSNDLQLIVTALIHSLDRQRSLRWDDIGSIAHALHGLKLYCRAVEGVRLGRGGGIPTSRAG